MAQLLTRRLLAAAAVVGAAAACGGRPKGLVPVSAAGSGSQSGPDALVLRVPLRGGTPRVYSYTHLDSVVWSGTDAAPALGAVLGFDVDAGAVVLVDDHERGARIDFRSGETGRISSEPVVDAVADDDGSALYGIDAKGEMTRLAPNGDWTYTPPRPARAVFPQRDGTVLVVGGQNAHTTVWKLYPPDPRIIDSASFPGTWRTLPRQVGDRLYLVVDSGLVSLSTQTLDWNPPQRFRKPIISAVSTPSGDRVFVATEASHEVSVVDRYRNRVTGHIALPGQPGELRVDPLGRYLLVRMRAQDSVWVVGIGTGRPIGAVATAWRPDLPFVGPDGAIALAQEKDVVFVDAETLRPARRVAGGASDVWFPFRWEGFQPRTSSLDQPVSFNLGVADSVRTAVDAAAADSAARAALAGGPVAPGAPPTADTVAAPVGYLVSFAALLSETHAQQLASEITVEGQQAHIVSVVRDGTAIYRVVLGPYPTRDEAERVGRESQHSYWVYEATP